MSSFVKITKDSIKGTITSVQSRQTITSCGNLSLDHILGGGIPIGSILLIEEDKFVTYSRVLAKYFLAEGICSEHSIFLGSLDDDVTELIKKLPKPIEDSSELNERQHDKSNLNNLQQNEFNDEMRIAWRYQNLPKVNSEALSSLYTENITKIGHNFNLLEKIDEETINKSDIELWDNNYNNDGTINPIEHNIFDNAIYYDFLEKLSNHIQKSLMKLCTSLTQSTQKDDSGKSTNKKNILRICITSLGSPLWYSDVNFIDDFLKFLQILKSIVRNNLCVCFLTIPMHLIRILNDDLPYRIRNLCDYSVELESFAGSDKETNPTFKEYNGLLNIKRMTALNSLKIFLPETTDLAFKLRRKKFVIEKLHLPPEIQDNEQDEGASSLSCGSSSKHLMEF